MRGQSWLVSNIPITLGRSPRCELVVNDPLVSRRHCRIYEQDQTLVMEDLGSSNRSLVNGVPVEKCELNAGDVVSVGVASFIVTQTQSTPPVTHFTAAKSPTKPILGDRSQALRGELGASLSSGKPETVADLVALYSMGHALGVAADVPDLLRVTAEHVAQRFGPELVHLSYYDPATRELCQHTPDHNASEACALTATQAIRDKRALLQPQRNSKHLKTGLSLTLSAPMFHNQTPVGAITIWSTTQTAVYYDNDLELLMAMANVAAPFFLLANRMVDLEQKIEHLEQDQAHAFRLLGKSKAMAAVRDKIQTVARSTLNVLLTGETGTGKELAAHMLHECSDRADGPFVALNCAAIPGTLLESELFGHEAGAFTGASGQRVGRLEQAHGGTLFLDEIGELSMENQARLLRAIEYGRFHRVGGHEEIQVDVRLVSATNRDLEAELDAGRYRSDLYHRICGLDIRLPSLRERPSDIKLLAHHFFGTAMDRANRNILGISPEAMNRLEKAPWPGNVRQLKNAIEAAVVMAKGEWLEPDDFARASASAAADQTTGTLDEIERQHIARVLGANNWNISKAARVLGIHRSTLYAKIDQHRLQR